MLSPLRALRRVNFRPSTTELLVLGIFAVSISAVIFEDWYNS